MSIQSNPDAGERSRRYGLREGAFYAVMQGGGENYLSAFAVVLHATTFQIGLLSALPQLVGTWAQLLSVKVLTQVEHRKALILAGAGGQALAWLPILALPLLFPVSGPWLLIACAVLYFAMGHFATPAWNSLMADLVDPNGRGSYFSHRSRIIAVCSFAALCMAGVILHGAETWGYSVAGFVVIFVLAAAARIISTRQLAQVEELVPAPTREAPFSLMGYVCDPHNTDLRRFLLFSALMHAAVLIAGPYFVVYMLRDLRLSYLDYTAWMAMQLFGQLISLRRWGKIADRFGNKKVLVVTGLTVPFLPMLYLVSQNLIFMTVVNFWGGIIWAGLTLGLQNYVFDIVAPRDRAKGVAIMNSLNAIGWFAGALLGSWMAVWAPSVVSVAGYTLSLASNLPVVFFISGLLRLVVSLSLLRTFREGRSVESITHRQLVMELPLIKPLAAAFSGRIVRQS